MASTRSEKTGYPKTLHTVKGETDGNQINGRQIDKEWTQVRSGIRDVDFLSGTKTSWGRVLAPEKKVHLTEGRLRKLTKLWSCMYSPKLVELVEKFLQERLKGSYFFLLTKVIKSSNLRIHCFLLSLRKKIPRY